MAACWARVFVQRGCGTRDLPAKTTVTMEPGDALILRTVGGGYGTPAQRDAGAAGAMPATGSRRGMTAAEVCAALRVGAIAGPTERLAPDNVQANLAVVPRVYADDLCDLCARNSVPCPLVEEFAPSDDLRTDLGRYRVWRDNELAERPRRRARAVVGRAGPPFLIGCSFTFDHALAQAGLAPRDYAQDRNVPMYRTRVPLAATGRLRGTMVVSMRPYKRDEIERVREVTRPYRLTYGEPVTWDDRRRWASRTSRTPSTATRRCSRPATCRSSGAAALPRRA